MAEVWSNSSSSKNEDVWDDTELIKMYEQSISSTYKKVQKPIKSVEFTTPEGVKYTWKIGSKCMAPYKEDDESELEYFPAVINWIGGDKNQEARVTFEGYGNEETVFIKDLWDEKEAATDEGTETDVVMESPKVAKTPKKKHHHNHHSKSPKMPVLAPPPPPGLLNMVAPDEVEALSSMLMSWYMSGYHTGYYQAMSDAKNKSGCSSSKH